MVLIPAGPFTMGDTFGEGDSSELPLHTNQISAFYIDKYEVTKALWDGVYEWAMTNGYSFESRAQGRATDHPAHSMAWYDAVKWCNARSQKEGRTPAYYTSAAQTTVYRSGEADVQTDWVKWSSGYRLPTEAEWEKAARGGAAAHRFPWSNTDNITHSMANYDSNASSAYDTSSTRGYHPTFATGDYPYTSPVGYFAANGYGLYDMAGNVWEWCWDWYDKAYYSSSPGTDPRGPASGSSRVHRGGSWSYYAYRCRAARRFYYYPAGRNYYFGFRSVLPPGQ
jgi:formylglycine-generating enzyme required for sulfatase activity